MKMNRRALLALATGTWATVVGAAVPEGKQKVEFGDWLFELPADWKYSHASKQGVTFFESADGNKGLGLKLVKPADDDARTPEQRATALLVGVRDTLMRPDPSRWRVVSTHSGVQQGAYRTEVDLFNDQEHWRILAVVMANLSEAVNMDLHDTVCTDHAASVEYFAPIAGSLRHR